MCVCVTVSFAFHASVLFFFIFVLGGQGSFIIRGVVGLLISLCSSSMELVLRYALEILVISLVMFIYFGGKPRFAD